MAHGIQMDMEFGLVTADA